MKFLIVSSLFMFMFTCVRSQDSTTTLSHFEKFISQPGGIIKTEMLQLGQYGPYKVLKCAAANMATGERTFAVRIDNNYSFDFPEALTNPQALYIDSLDLDSFIATAEGFVKASENTQLSFNTRYSYLTSADVQLSCYFVKFSNNWGFEIDKVFQKLRTRIPGTDLILNKKRMQQLIALLKQAKQKI